MLASDLNVYSRTELAKLSGLSSRRVNRWLTGYQYKNPKGEARNSAPLIRRASDCADLSASFADLIEVLLVRSFLKHGVSMPTLMKAAAVAKQLFKSPH
jgi:hypothetical protein